MPQAVINIWAVLVAAIANMAIGSIWYSPVMFANPWMKLVGKKPQDLKKNATTGYLVTAIGSLVMAFVLAHIICYVGAKTVLEGATTGFWLWLGFVATTTLVDYIFAGRRKKLYLIIVGYSLVALVVMGAILAVWT